MQEITIHWFRRDLRLLDNTSLFHALKNNKNILPIFIFDTFILDELSSKKDTRVSFIYETLKNIKEELQTKFQSDIAVFYGKPMEIFQQLVKKHKITAVYTNEDYEPYGKKRDQEISDFLISKNISFHLFKDHVIFKKGEILKPDGKIYKVYTPYMRKWKEKMYQTDIKELNLEIVSSNFIQNVSFPFPSLESIGFEISNQKVLSFQMSKTLLNSYAEKRDFPAIEGTSFISPHLRFGTVSIRKLVNYAKETKDPKQIYLNELIWREFFMQIFDACPETEKEPFKKPYNNILWRNNEEEFKKWCDGKTGYPLVDAGMRELNETGYMHNRVRMVVGSFLCKHLLIDWTWGERYFAEKLLDFELSSNVGNWQWVAGCGADAAPYFRVFNPETQLTKFDKDLKYVKKWIPEFGTNKYPKPIVEHKFARERVLKAYKDALGK
ncbi:cryptochrome/photolyase family protein [Aureivirga marina]|uniref:cryptochrome/photolyase family protein n=1 Tax=Aureivirga marina TaxID=1182451 RepID=UPI0018C8D8EC|nr:deoxyribodipyrimidine photo-lyase [Aureivirga marina]